MKGRHQRKDTCVCKVVNAWWRHTTPPHRHSPCSIWQLIVRWGGPGRTGPGRVLRNEVDERKTSAKTKKDAWWRRKPRPIATLPVPSATGTLVVHWITGTADGGPGRTRPGRERRTLSLGLWKQDISKKDARGCVVAWRHITSPPRRPRPSICHQNMGPAVTMVRLRMVRP